MTVTNHKSWTTITNADWGTTTTWNSSSVDLGGVVYEPWTPSDDIGTKWDLSSWPPRFIPLSERELLRSLEALDIKTAQEKVIEYVLTHHRTPAP